MADQASLVAQMVNHLPTMQETWLRSLGREDPLEKEMATHPSFHAWEIPWTNEPGGLQSMGLKRVGHDWATSFHLPSLNIWQLISAVVYFKLKTLKFNSTVKLNVIAPSPPHFILLMSHFTSFYLVYHLTNYCNHSYFYYFFLLTIILVYKWLNLYPYYVFIFPVRLVHLCVLVTN